MVKHTRHHYASRKTKKSKHSITRKHNAQKKRQEIPAKHLFHFGLNKTSLHNSPNNTSSTKMNCAPTVKRHQH